VQNERPGHYWARQFNLDGRNVTMGLLATNVAAYGMQMISPGFTRFCMRVSWGSGASAYSALQAAYVTCHVMTEHSCYHICGSDHAVLAAGLELILTL
jgi:hypothetical protein